MTNNISEFLWSTVSIIAALIMLVGLFSLAVWSFPYVIQGVSYLPLKLANVFENERQCPSGFTCTKNPPVSCIENPEYKYVTIWESKDNYTTSLKSHKEKIYQKYEYENGTEIPLCSEASQ